MPTIKTLPKDKETVKIIVPENTVAKVTERRNKDNEVTSRTAIYEAEVTQENEDTDTEDYNERESDFSEIGGEDVAFETEIKNVAPIPKNKLEIMFSMIRRALADQPQLEDYFLASITRMPDAIGNRFNTRCSTQEDLGAFQFTSNDQFNFQSEIQSRNKNSGGIFNVRIYKMDHAPLTIERGAYSWETRGQASSIEVGMVNYSVPDPVATLDTRDNDHRDNSNSSQHMLLEFMRQSEDRFAALLESINKPKETSDLEKLIMQKAIENLLNPPESKGNKIEETIASVVGSTVVMQKMGEQFALLLGPKEPPAAAELSTFEMISKALEMPAVQNVVGAVTDVSERWMISKMQGQTQTVETPERQPEQQTQPLTPQQEEQQRQFNEMQNLISNLIAELESERELNAENQFIKNLQSQYPTQAQTLITACKGMEFDLILKMLVQQCDTFTPNPMIPFFDLEAIRANGNTQFVYNERGTKAIERLKEFYEFVKTL